MMCHEEIGTMATSWLRRLGRVEVVLAVALLPLWAGAALAQETGTEPTFKEGIPGLKMVDVRDHKFLWAEIEQLQSWEHSDRITIAEYRSKVFEKTAHFLELGGTAADTFTRSSADAVATVRESFLSLRRSGEDPSALDGRFSSDLDDAVARVGSFLQEERPRHRLFAPDCKKWLLKLAFGPSEAKETKEAHTDDLGS